MKLPFSPYDFFGYLSSGLAAVIGFDVLINGQPTWSWGHDLTSSEIILLTFLAYILGQVIASPSKLFLETFCAKYILGDPVKNLMRDQRPIIIGWLLFEYFTPLDEGTRSRVRDVAKLHGVTTWDNKLFFLAWSLVKRDDSTMVRLNSFRDQYGFNRNVSFTFLTLGFVGLVTHMTKDNFPPLAWICLAIIIGSGLFVRFLKFYRHYSWEVLVRFSIPKDPKANA